MGTRAGEGLPKVLQQFCKNWNCAPIANWGIYTPGKACREGYRPHPRLVWSPGKVKAPWRLWHGDSRDTFGTLITGLLPLRGSCPFLALNERLRPTTLRATVLDCISDCILEYVLIPEYISSFLIDASSFSFLFLACVLQLCYTASTCGTWILQALPVSRNGL